MCGITGVFNLQSASPIDEALLRQMLGMIRHRGPDQFGLYRDSYIGLGSARLSIIDLSSGQQPIANEDQTMWIVFNGEIFNYIELRSNLEACGHRFVTHSDTEVILHLYEEYGVECLHHLNGQFAFAIWDTRRQRLFIARDRLGIRPLFYTQAGGQFLFGSEIKALLVHPQVQAEIEPQALHEIFTFWSPLPGHTAFKLIQQLPPGHYLSLETGRNTVEPVRYWQLDFSGPLDPRQLTLAEAGEQLRALLVEATLIQLRADVPVGAYLSGGLDSAVTAAIIRRYTTNRLNTFSITFSDPAFDESAYQQQMADFLGTTHHVVQATHANIGEVFPEVIWHTEVPLTRTAPAPMMLLARAVRQQQFKVVMTGEGADEFLAGYDIFKESHIRRFWARQPASQLRPLLLRRLYRDIDHDPQASAFLVAFFQTGLTETHRADYSHMLRWRNTYRARRFFASHIQQAVPQWEALLKADAVALGIPLPADYPNWQPLHRAQYLESVLFLPEYLLASQGDRMAMAHGVEGRYPFLDHRVVEFCNRLPAQYKLKGLTEKYLLKRLAKDWLPPAIQQRPKRPYRAPITLSFFNAAAPPYVRDLLAPDAIRQSGHFNPNAVQNLVQKIDNGLRLGETDDMALVGILSTQLLHQQFIADLRRSPAITDADDIKVVVSTLTP